MYHFCILETNTTLKLTLPQLKKSLTVSTTRVMCDHACEGRYLLEIILITTAM